jgi:hypothetical protein
LFEPHRVLLRIVCACLFIGTLSAGLWPFHAPRNAVTWLNDGGLSIGEYGTVVSANALKHADSGEYGPCSLEIWLKPNAANNHGTVVAFFRPDNFVVSFAVRQSLADLELRRGALTRHPPGTARVYADDVFSSGQSVFFTITSSFGGTNIYSDGKLLRQLPDFKLSVQDFSGRLMIGNAPGLGDNWSGEIRGLAIYSRQLSADEVVKQYRTWVHSNSNAFAGNRDAFALYRFKEGGGGVAHNQIETTADLQIPGRFFILHQQFLELPWDEFHAGWSYWANLALNVIAFFPLGFFFCALFWPMTIIERRLLATISLGFAVSLTIEVLQAFLPTRKSGVTDLLTNTLGTALGAISFSYAPLNDWRARLVRYWMVFRGPVTQGRPKTNIRTQS